MTGLKVLIVDDEAPLAAAIALHLSAVGLVVDHVCTIEDADAAMLVTAFDVIVLELRLPDGSGRDLLRRMRDRSDPTSVLVVSARDDVPLRVQLLDAGADDYLVKPFVAVELLARVRALLRRPRKLQPQMLELAGASLDPATGQLRVGQHSQVLPPREARALSALMRRPGHLVTRDVMEGALYALDEAVTPNAMERVISRLRRRLMSMGAGVSVLSMRGLGYVLTATREPD